METARALRCIHVAVLPVNNLPAGSFDTRVLYEYMLGTCIDRTVRACGAMLFRRQEQLHLQPTREGNITPMVTHYRARNSMVKVSCPESKPAKTGVVPHCARRVCCFCGKSPAGTPQKCPQSSTGTEHD